MKLVFSYYNNTYKREFKQLDESFVKAYERKEFNEVNNEKNTIFYIINEAYFNETYEDIIKNKNYDSIIIKADINTINLISVDYFSNDRFINYVN